MSPTQKERHTSYEYWLKQMEFPLVAHRFFITTCQYNDKRGYKRTSVEILGENWNGHILFPPAFPTAFVKYVTDTVKGKTDEYGQVSYKIGYGKLAGVYAAYRRSIDRIATIDEILLDLENNPSDYSN